MTWDGIDRDDPKKVRREGQRIGDIEVVCDSGRRTKKCEILWECRRDNGETVYKKSSWLSKRARALSLPKPQ